MRFRARGRVLVGILTYTYNVMALQVSGLTPEKLSKDLFTRSKEELAAMRAGAFFVVSHWIVGGPLKTKQKRVWFAF